MSEQSEQWYVGSAQITSIVEHAVADLPPEIFYPQATAETVKSHAWLAPDWATPDGLIGLSVRAFIIKTTGRTLLVDPCVGNGKQRMFPLWNDASFPFLARLEAAGLAVGDVDAVVHTHLHPDHTGWDTHKAGDAWVPTFEHARHLYTQRELDHWQDSAQRQGEDVWGDSVAPIFDAGLADIVAEDADLGGGLRLAPTPGHTPGHVSLWVESEGEVAVISGDVVTHPLQCAETHLSHAADWDAELGRASRRGFLENVLAKRALLLVNHFPNRCGGHLSTEGDGYKFTVADGGGGLK